LLLAATTRLPSNAALSDRTAVPTSGTCHDENDDDDDDDDDEYKPVWLSGLWATSQGDDSCIAN
jgi:hypothetical protein